MSKGEKVIEHVKTFSSLASLGKTALALIVAILGPGFFGSWASSMNMRPWIWAPALALLVLACAALYFVPKIKRLREQREQLREQIEQRDEKQKQERSPPPERQKAAWEVVGARTRIFTLGDLACLLAGAAPAVPFPNRIVEQEYKELV